MLARTTARGALAAAAASVLLVGGAAVAVAATSSSGPTGLCLADGAPVTSAKADASGALTCPSGRTLLLVPAQDAVRALQAVADQHEDRLRFVENQAFGTGERLSQLEERAAGLEQRADETSSQLFGLDVRLGQVAGDVSALDERVRALAGRVDALDRRTQVSTVSAPATLSGSAQVVSCGTGSALSGSARTTQATLAQSHPTADGRGWSFLLQAAGKSPSATLFVVCSGASGATPTPGGSTGPTGPGVEPAPGTP